MFFPKSIFITGANRGLGLEMVRHLLNSTNPPKHLFATCRNLDSAKELQELAVKYPIVHIHKFDVTEPESIVAMVKWADGLVGEEGLNLLINNAGRYSKVSLAETTKDTLIDDFTTNAVGPFLISKAFIPLLERAAKFNSDHPLGWSRAAIVSITSKMGSISDNTSGGSYSYRTSKTALNMIMKSLSVDVLPSNIITLLLHPGWVRTRMGGPDGLIDPDFSVSNMLRTISELKGEDNGGYKNYDGKPIAW